MPGECQGMAQGKQDSPATPRNERDRSSIDSRFVIRSFSERRAILHHSEAVEKIGLWPSERIVFSRYLEPTDSILDIGCGAGRTTVGLLQAGFARVTALDISPAMICEAAVIARRLGIGCELAVADACLVPFPVDSFDGAIFSFNGLMQIPQDRNRLRVLEEVRRIVRAGGFFIFTTGERTKHEFWRRQREVWSRGIQDPRLFEYGDVILKEDIHREGFLHFPSIGEMNELIGRSGWNLIENTDRRAICPDGEAVDRFAGHCLFWVLSNPSILSRGQGDSAQCSQRQT